MNRDIVASNRHWRKRAHLASASSNRW